MRRCALILFALLGLVSCSSGDQVTWQACPDYYGANTECATLHVPLAYGDPSRGTIASTVFRVLGTSATKKGQIWFLEGGPGDANVIFANFFRSMSANHPDWDFYSIDHRGVGNSTKLTCAAVGNTELTSLNAAECVSELEARWGQNLSQFSTTNAAKDIDYAIEKIREPDKKVFVYGLSYGTYLLHRYLEQYPDKIDGFIFDSICPTGICKLDLYDTNINAAAEQVMDICAADATCQGKLASIDADPWTATGIIYDRIDAGTICDDLKTVITRQSLRNKLAKLVEMAYSRSLIPATIYRIDRCSDGDVSVLTHLMTAESGSGASSTVMDLNSPVLGMNIILSELWNSVSVAEEQQIIDGAYASEDSGVSTAAISALDVWPLYTDQYIGRWGSSNLPILMMNSNIDGQTPFAWAENFASHFTGSSQYLIEMPDAAHGTLFTLPMADDVELQNESCGMKIMFSFVENASVSPDTSCLNSAFTLSFDPSTPQNKYISNMFFGTEDIWD